MNNDRQTFTSKLEEIFLSILRNVILLVLASSIIGSIGLLISGLSDTSAEPGKYKYEKFDSKQLVNDLKESLKDEAKQAPEPQKPTNKKQDSKQNDKINDEVNKQLKILGEFLKKYGYETNQGIATNLKNNANNYGGIYADGEAGALEYAKGQTQLFELVFQDKDLNALVQKKYNSELEQEDKNNFITGYFAKAVDAYPNFHQNQISKYSEFEQEQNAEAALRQAGASLKLYIAAGLFGAFLLISLILVLVKIERNLRLVRVQPDSKENLQSESHHVEQPNT